MNFLCPQCEGSFNTKTREYRTYIVKGGHFNGDRGFVPTPDVDGWKYYLCSEECYSRFDARIKNLQKRRKAK